MKRLFNTGGRLFEMLMAAMLALMVVLVFGNVVLRYAFNSGISVSEELSRWIFVWLTFIGAIVAMKDNGHLGTDVLVSRLPPREKKFCFVVARLLMLYLTWLIFTGSLQQTVLNWGTSAPVSGMSMALFYGIGVVFAVTTALILLRGLWLAFSGRIDDQDVVMVKESEQVVEPQRLETQTTAEDSRARPEDGAHWPSAGDKV